MFWATASSSEGARSARRGILARGHTPSRGGDGARPTRAPAARSSLPALRCFSARSRLAFRGLECLLAQLRLDGGTPSIAPASVREVELDRPNLPAQYQPNTDSP